MQLFKVPSLPNLFKKSKDSDQEGSSTGAEDETSFGSEYSEGKRVSHSWFSLKKKKLNKIPKQHPVVKIFKSNSPDHKIPSYNYPLSHLSHPFPLKSKIDAITCIWLPQGSCSSTSTELGFESVSVTGELELALAFNTNTSRLEITVGTCRNLSYGDSKKRKCHP